MMFRFCLALAMAGAVGSDSVATEPIRIGSRLELFVDDYLIDELDGAELTLHHPTPREVAIEHDMPWEGNVSDYHTMFQDGDIFRMYYSGDHVLSLDPFRGRGKSYTCYAESDDGIHWKKPKLGLVEFKGSKENNIIWAGIGTHNFAPFKDANPDCKPAEKYKALASQPTGIWELVAFVSPDGIHWSLVSDKPVITKGSFDSLNLAFWDTLRGRYVSFYRGFRGKDPGNWRDLGGIRDILTCTSDDFLHWSEPPIWLEYPGARKEHLYTNQIRPYFRAPHILVGFPRRFIPERKGLNGQPGLTDGLFMTSRDGVTFKRWPEAFIRPGLQTISWHFRNNLICNALLVTKSAIPGNPDELSVFSTEDKYISKSDRIRRFTIRMDGFVSVHAKATGGEMLTKQIVFEGKELVMNFSTSAAGSVQVEIQNIEGQPMPGFTLADSAEIFGDRVEHVVKWKGGSDVSKLAGKPVRLRFALKDADLYSIRFR